MGSYRFQGGRVVVSRNKWNRCERQKASFLEKIVLGLWMAGGGMSKGICLDTLEAGGVWKARTAMAARCPCVVHDRSCLAGKEQNERSKRSV